MFSKKGFVTICLVILAALLITGCAPTTPMPVAVGDSYGGGIVAYILVNGDTGYDPSVQHGLIAATADQSTGIQWGSYGNLIGGTETDIGAGQSNTTTIVTWLNSHSETGRAAQLCNDLIVDGYNDWFLPSKDELDKLYINKVAIGGFADYGYWSSSEYDAYSAWYQYFYNGVQDYSIKTSHTARVRAIRAF